MDPLLLVGSIHPLSISLFVLISMEFLALRCCECNTFNSQQRTKSHKWQCKLCGAKQSIARVFFQSPRAADIRTYILQATMQRGEKELARHDQIVQRLEAGTYDESVSQAAGIVAASASNRRRDVYGFEDLNDESEAPLASKEYTEAQEGASDPRFVFTTAGLHKGKRKRDSHDEGFDAGHRADIPVGSYGLGPSKGAVHTLGIDHRRLTVDPLNKRAVAADNINELHAQHATPAERGFGRRPLEHGGRSIDTHPSVAADSEGSKFHHEARTHFGGDSRAPTGGAAASTSSSGVVHAPSGHHARHHFGNTRPHSLNTLGAPPSLQLARTHREKPQLGSASSTGIPSRLSSFSTFCSTGVAGADGSSAAVSSGPQVVGTATYALPAHPPAPAPQAGTMHHGGGSAWDDLY